MLHFLQTSYSSRNLAWSVMVEEPLLLFRVNFPFKLLAHLLALSVSFEVCCSLPQGFAHSNLIAAYATITFSLSQNDLSCNVTVVSLKYCTVKDSSVWVSPDNEYPLVVSSSSSVFRFTESFWACQNLMSCSMSIFSSMSVCLCSLPSTSNLCSHLFTILYSSSHNASLMDPHSFK